MADYRSYLRDYRESSALDAMSESRIRARLRRAERSPEPWWSVGSAGQAAMAGGLVAVVLLWMFSGESAETPAPSASSVSPPSVALHTPPPPDPLPASPALAASPPTPESSAPGRAAPPVPDPVELHLARTAVSVGARVWLRPDGAGDARGSADNLHIFWSSGTLGVEVEPNAGVALAVETDEAVLRVVGTGFSVRRDRRGTELQVSHGRVAIRCLRPGSEPERTLDAGAALSCPPATAVGALARLRLWEREGVNPATILEESVAARSLPGSSAPILSELGSVSVSALLQLNRPEEARAAAEQALRDTPGARDAELRRVAARLAASVGDCSAAHQHLSALVTLGAAPEIAAADPDTLHVCPLESP